MAGTLYNGTPEEDAARIAAEKAARQSAIEKSKAAVAAGGDPNWTELQGAYGTPGSDPKGYGRPFGNDQGAKDYAEWVKLWRERETQKNLGYSTPEEAWAAGMQAGPDPFYAAEAARWGKTAAPELWNAAGQRATRNASLDDLTRASQGGLAADLQSNITREAAAMAAARQGNSRSYNPLTGQTSMGGQAALVAGQPTMAAQGMDAAIKERAGRSAALGQGLASGRAQELAEATRMQEWSQKREALRQKLLGMGIQQRDRRYDLLGDYIRAKQANQLDEFQMAMAQRAAEKAREAGYWETGAQAVRAVEGLIPRDEGDDSGGGGSDYWDETMNATYGD
jgi:hypothetical protein